MSDTAQHTHPAPELLAQLPGGLNPVDLWLNLQSAQGSWSRIEDSEQRDNIMASNRRMLESLSAFPVSRWLAFNHAVGWIPAADTYLPAIALLIAARDEAPAMDVANAEAYVRQSLPPELGRMLALRGAVPAEWVRA